MPYSERPNFSICQKIAMYVEATLQQTSANPNKKNSVHFSRGPCASDFFRYLEKLCSKCQTVLDLKTLRLSGNASYSCVKKKP